MKKFLVLIISILMVCSCTACSEKKPASDAVTEKLPSKVDLRNYNGKNYITPVKRQSFGDCWSFSLAGSAEIAYLYANNMGVKAGKLNRKVNFSEKYTAWYMYHGITEDDVSNGKVRASQAGEGFDPKEGEESNPNRVYDIGGEFVHYANLYGSGFGPVDESVTVNGKHPYAYKPTSDDSWALPLNSEYRNAPQKAFLRNSLVLPSPAKYDSKGKYTFDKDALKAIKSELYKGHGVSLAVSVSHSGFIQENLAAYCDGDNVADHAVTVAGYDDNYPKEKFVQRDENGKIIKGSLPPKNGALIIKNSWGIVDSEDDGYCYTSYYDHSIFSPMSYEFDSEKSVKYKKLSYDQYDLMMTEWYGNSDYKDETKMANVFEAEENEKLIQISYITSLPDTEVSYEIYKDVDNNNPSSGELLEKGVNLHNFSGYHKVDLSGEYPLKKGERYSVILAMKRKTDDENAIYTEVFPYSTEFSGGLSVRGIINKGESYLYKNGKWTDMSEMKNSLIERAYKQLKNKLGSKQTFTPIKLKSKDTFTVDNYPIKAIAALRT